MIPIIIDIALIVVCFLFLWRNRHEKPEYMSMSWRRENIYRSGMNDS